MDEERTVVITGGTGGLGSAVTATLLEAGWRAVVPYNVAPERERLEADARIAPHADRLELVEADLFDGDQVASVVAAAGDGTRAVVNLVGGFAAGSRIHETPLEDFDRQMRLNLRPTYLVTAAALPHMLAARDGAIVCVSTRAALAAEYTADGLRANAILPSVIDTPANRVSQPDADHERWVSPDAIARVIRFLVSPDSEPISGAQIPVYGRA
jgi:NAD(P)-dependent dehydrogenase (short-subunit alcohol dehydrogenase family)